MRECSYDQRVAHKRRETGNKDVLEKQCKSTTVENQISNTRKEDSGQRSRSGKRRDTVNTEEEESSAPPVCFTLLNISLGTECYLKTEYSKL